MSKKSMREFAKRLAEEYDRIQNPRSLSEEIKRSQEKEKAEEEKKRQRFQKRKSKLAGLPAEQIEAKERRILALMKEGGE